MSGFRIWTLRALALGAVCLSLWLTWLALSVSPGGAGCLGDGTMDCDVVLSSRWSQFLGVPVSALSIAVYGAVLLFSFCCWQVRTVKERFFGACGLLAISTIIGTSAIWFVGLQMFVIGSFCTFCCLTHGIGILIVLIVVFSGPFEFVRVQRPPDGGAISEEAAERPWARLPVPAETVWSVILFSLLPVAILVVGQSVSRPPVVTSTIAAVPAESSVALREGEVTLLGGRIAFLPDDFPLLGRHDARHMAVVLSDPTCPFCRVLMRDLQQLQQESPEQFLFRIVPMPMSAMCNRLIKSTAPQHRQACYFARAALSVWDHDPNASALFELWLYESTAAPTVADAREKILSLNAPSSVVDPRPAPALDARIELGVRMFEIAGSGQMPKVIVRDTVFSGLPDRVDQIRTWLEEQTQEASAGASNGKPASAATDSGSVPADH